MNVLLVDYRAKNAPELFTQSLRETGFAVINHHPIDQSLITQVYNDWKVFFSDKRKFDYHFDEQTQAGYYPIDVSEKAKGYDVKDIKEFFSYYPWARYPDFMGPATKQLAKEMMNLAITLLGWIEDNTPNDIKNQFSMPLSDMIIDSPKTLFRIIHYPPLTGKEEPGALRAAEHEDINLITCLPAATGQGLQVKDTSGHWHDVPGDLNSIAVNIGDMLQMCSKGYFPSTTHRVINPTGEATRESRLAMPLFLQPRDEVRLSGEFTAREFWDQRYRELGLLK